MADNIYRKTIKLVLWTVLIALVIYLLFLLVDIIVILAFSVLLAFIFTPFVHLLEQEGLNRLTATSLVFLAFGFLLYLGLSFVIPKFILQLNQLISSLEGFSLDKELQSIEESISSFLPVLEPGELSKRVENFISSQLVNSLENLTILLTSIVSVIAVVVIVPFVTFFLLKDSSRIQRAIIHIVPNKYFEIAYWILKRVSLQLGRFVRAWIFDATFVGILIGFGFYIIGIPNALPLGVIAGLGHLIPYLGPVIGGLPAAVISIMQTGDLSQIPFIAIIVFGTYAIDNGLVQPYVFAKSVDMHPIVIILLIIAGSQIFGLLGMLLAVPIATVLKTMATEIYFALKNYKIARV